MALDLLRLLARLVKKIERHNGAALDNQSDAKQQQDKPIS
jgi:hypothetical protein